MVMVTTPVLSTKEEPLNFIIKEATPSYTKHDQLFKQLIETFFEEFIEAFFPDLHEQIDFKEVTFLSEEVLPVKHDENKSILDLVVEVRVKDLDALVVIHVEPQSYVQTDFNERMFRYSSMLYNRLRKSIIPIALLDRKSVV